MKSALTGALAGAPQQPIRSSDAKDDVQSFPQLRDATAELTAEDAAAMETARAETASVTPVGSMPTYDGPGVDYEINPRNRRGGQEISNAFTTGSSVDRRTSSSLHSDVMAGSLGKSMTDHAMKEIASSLGVSPTAALLSELAAEKIHSRTGDAKKLRRHVLRGAVVVFVTAGYSGKRFIYERAKELGVRVVILDSEDSWSKSLVDAGTIEKFVPVDFSDGDLVFDRCMEAITKVKEELGDVDGLSTFCELAVPLMTRLCEVCGLPGNPSEAVDNARNKHSTRAVMAKAGLPTPDNMLLKEMPDKEAEEAQLLEAAEKVGFPAVLKPIHGAASLGVIRCNDLPQLKKAYTQVAHELKSARVVAGAIIGGADDDAGNAGGWICLDMIFEQYLDGPEVDVDIVLSEGKAVYGAVSDNWPTIEPYFNETGSNSPSILPQSQQKELLDLSVQTLEALGFQMGAFHVEGKYTSKGPRLIEVNCRMGGGPVRDINLLVWGVDMVEEQLMASVGIPCRPVVAPKPLRQIAEMSCNAKKSGILQHTDYLGDWTDHPDVLYVRPVVKPGGKVVCVDDGMPTWVCEMMVEKPTVQEAIKMIEEMDVDISSKMPIV